MVEFFALGDGVGAKREWMHLLGQLSPAERRQAGLIASRQGWAELGILALNQAPDRKLYAHRFPLLETETLLAMSKQNALDPAFVAGLIRQESAWNPSIASHAGAIGLMQMLPSTAQITAKSLGWKGNSINLRDAKTNLTLGTKHLADLSAKYDRSPILMTAAYNAGPNALKRWFDPLYAQHPDLWIETVPYKETREYIATVLAFTVIYDYRFDRKLSRLSARVPEFKHLLPKLSESSVPTRCNAKI
ncbi:MAG: transglycosylase SLT domain-containing protein [Akkermansiaceae bacterium]|nr:transglycosylase SLT domain-containing protein [Akkermansiaceae bacterium]